MFYDRSILSKKGKLATVWLASIWNSKDKKYPSRNDFKKVNIRNACEYILYPRIPFALRLSAKLMFGVVKVHNEQVKIVLDEVNRSRSCVKALRLSTQLELAQPEMRREAITLPFIPLDPDDMDWLFPELHQYNISFDRFDAKLQLPSLSSSQQQKDPCAADPKDITLPEPEYTISKFPEEFQEEGFGEPLPHEIFSQNLEAFGQSPDELFDQNLEPPEKRQKQQGVSNLMESTEIPDPDVFLFDEQEGTAKSQSSPTDQFHLPVTPQEQEIVHRAEPERPTRKRKRKGLIIDFKTKLTDADMRRNFRTVDNLKRKKIFLEKNAKEVPTVEDLFDKAATKVVNNNKNFKGFWLKNAEVKGYIEEFRSSPVERAASHLSDFEQSGVTPQTSLLDSGKSRDLSLSERKIDDIVINTPLRRVSKVDRTILPTIADLEELEDDFEVPLSIDEHQIIPEQDELLSLIVLALKSNSHVRLTAIMPLTTPRKAAAKYFYKIMTLANNRVIILDQECPYEDIFIRRGAEY